MANTSFSWDDFNLTEDPVPSTSGADLNPGNHEIRSKVKVVINCLIVTDSRG